MSCSRGLCTAFPCGLSQGVGNWHFGCSTLLSPGRPEQPHTSLRCFPLASALCRPHTRGWMMVPTAASSTPGTATVTSDGALLCTAPGPGGFYPGKHNALWHSHESAPLISTTSPAAAPDGAKGRAPVSSCPPRSGKASRKTGVMPAALVEQHPVEGH